MVTKYECLQYLTEVVEDALVIVWGVGTGTGNEWYHLRPNPPFMTIEMGIATPTGLGLALALPHRRVVVIDTDGGLLLNLGVLATLGNIQPPNLKVFVMDNECYELVGGFPTATAGATDLAAMAKGAGVVNAKKTETLEQFEEAALRAMNEDAFHFVVAKIEKGMEKVPAPHTDSMEMKYKFVRYIEETEGIKIIMGAAQPMPKGLVR